MQSLRAISTRSNLSVIPKSFIHTSNVISQNHALHLSRAQLKKDLFKEHGLKKPSSAYIIFTQSYRQKMKDSNPGLSTKEITKKLGAQWSSLSENEKQPFVEEYKRKFEVYKKSKDEIESLLPPKKPVNAFVLFANDTRPMIKNQYPEIDQIETTKKIAEMWKGLSQEKKLHYQNLYKENMDAWKQSSSI